MFVTMDVYSGVPNPTWELSEADSKRLLERVAGRTVVEAADAPPVLGFRGFIISRGPFDAAAEAANLPDSFRIDAQLASEVLQSTDVGEPASAELTADDKEDALSFLLGTSEGAVDDELLEIARKTISASKEPQPMAEAALRPAACIIQNPSYNPGFWNTPAVQPGTTVTTSP